MYLLYLLHFFFFKQKTVYEMRISNCSSDVCSSDLAHKKRAGVSSGPFLKSLRCRSGAGDVGRVDLYAGAHRRRQRDLFDIFALRARRLRLDDRIDESVEVLARSEAQTSELKSLMRLSYAVFSLKTKI